MITIRQRSGQTIILGTNGEKTIIEALNWLYLDAVDSDRTKAEYIQSLIKELKA